MAQQTSINISSLSFSFKTFANEGIALFTFEKSGGGLPLQKFDRAQLAFLIKLVPGAD